MILEVGSFTGSPVVPMPPCVGLFQDCDYIAHFHARIYARARASSAFPAEPFTIARKAETPLLAALCGNRIGKARREMLD
jgi:hypothetical protein